jgi:hypothetical protein
LSSNGEVSSAGVPDLSSRVIAELPLPSHVALQGLWGPSETAWGHQNLGVTLTMPSAIP